MFKSKNNKIILGTAQFKRGYGTFNNSKFAKKDITKILKLSKNIKSIQLMLQILMEI